MGYKPPLSTDVTTPQGSSVASLVGTANVEAIIQANSLNQLAIATANYNMNGFGLVNEVAGTNIGNPATWEQLPKANVRLATAVALPANTYNNGTAGVGATLTENANGALSVDGIAVAVGDRILVRSEATAANNGIYTVTATGSAGAVYVLTRAIDYNQASLIALGDRVFSIVGNTLAHVTFFESTAGWPGGTVGTTAIGFAVAGPPNSTSGITGGADVALSATTATTISTSASLEAAGTYLVLASATIIATTLGTFEISIVAGTGTIFGIGGQANDEVGIATGIAGSLHIMGVVTMGTTAGTIILQAFGSTAGTVKRTGTHYGAGNTAMTVVRLA